VALLSVLSGKKQRLCQMGRQALLSLAQTFIFLALNPLLSLSSPLSYHIGCHAHTLVYILSCQLHASVRVLKLVRVMKVILVRTFLSWELGALSTDLDIL
jgi:hypothetical protein